MVLQSKANEKEEKKKRRKNISIRYLFILKNSLNNPIYLKSYLVFNQTELLLLSHFKIEKQMTKLLFIIQIMTKYLK